MVRMMDELCTPVSCREKSLGPVTSRFETLGQHICTLPQQSKGEYKTRSLHSKRLVVLTKLALACPA